MRVRDAPTDRCQGSPRERDTRSSGMERPEEVATQRTPTTCPLGTARTAYGRRFGAGVEPGLGASGRTATAHTSARARRTRAHVRADLVLEQPAGLRMRRLLPLKFVLHRLKARVQFYLLFAREGLVPVPFALHVLKARVDPRNLVLLLLNLQPTATGTTLQGHVRHEDQ